jgi:CRISPR-associated protein Cas2
MRILVTYDVSTETPAGKRRLRKVALVCLAFGQRVQKSVFECTLTEMQLAEFERRLVRCINEKEDSLRIYRLREDREQYLKIYGIAHDIDFDAPLIV